jgi:hypothetical protein
MKSIYPSADPQKKEKKNAVARFCPRPMRPFRYRSNRTNSQNEPTAEPSALPVPRDAELDSGAATFATATRRLRIGCPACPQQAHIYLPRPLSPPIILHRPCLLRHRHMPYLPLLPPVPPGPTSPHSPPLPPLPLLKRAHPCRAPRSLLLVSLVRRRAHTPHQSLAEASNCVRVLSGGGLGFASE